MHKLSFRIGLVAVLFLFQATGALAQELVPICKLFQAESNYTVVTASVNTSVANSGYNGSGYLDFGGNGTGVKWTVNIPQACEGKFTARHANGGTTNRQCALSINGINVGNISFAPTGGWTNWTATDEMTINLIEGENTIQLMANTSAGGPNLDEFTLCYTGLPLSNDATLNNLTVSTGQLIPTFSSENTDYNITVGYAVSSISVSATATHQAATVADTGTVALAVGENIVNIRVIAEDGTTQKTYKITINREELADDHPPLSPPNLTANNITCSSLRLEWKSSTDDTGILGYEVYKNSRLLTFTTDTSLQIYNLSQLETYTFGLIAVDLAQKKSDETTLSPITLPDCPESDYTNIIGIGISGPKDWEEAFIFADAMMSSRQWTGTSVDANGWPTGDGEIYVAAISNLHGTYKMRFTGNADIAFNSATVSNKVYDSQTNTTTCDVVITRSDNFALKLTVKNSANGIKNIKLMRPIAPGASISHSFDELFHREIKDFLSQGFNLLRFMDFTGTNSDDHHLRKEFGYRLTPAYATQAADWDLNTYIRTNNATGKPYFRYQGVGAAWEYVILLCNELNTDCWINIPHCATDDHVRKIAQLFKFGSDGTNPYTSPQENPLYPPLNPHLKLYVEWSNETWNSLFPVWDWSYKKNNKGDMDFRHFNAKKAAEVSLIFREVFGDDQMMARIRPLFEWQRGKNESDYGNAQLTGTMGLVWIENNMSKPVNYYFWGGGGSGYYGPEPDASLEEVWNSAQMDPQVFIEPRQLWIAYVDASYGLRNAVYEGGPSFGDEYGGSGSNPIGEQILNDPRMADEIIEHQMAWNSIGGNVFTNFTLSGDHRWGWINHPNVPNAKIDGASQLVGKPRNPITAGTRVDSTGTSVVYGNRWKITSKSDGGYAWRNSAESDASFTLSTGLWVSYPYHVTRNGSYRVRIKGSGTGTVAVYDGSDLLGTYTFSGGETPWSTFSATTEYLRAIRVKATGSNITIASIEMEAHEDTAQEPEHVQPLTACPIQIYPNPVTNGILNVSAETDGRSIYVTICDLHGQTIACYPCAGSTAQLNVGDLAKGMYILCVKTETYTHQTKLIVQ